MSKEPVLETQEEVNNNQQTSSKGDDTIGNTDSKENLEQDPLAKLQTEVAEQKNNYLRLYAEFENYKKRSVKERMDLLKSASADTIVSMLPILDDFERALKASEELEENNTVRQGAVLIYNKLKSILEQKGLKPMESIGADFDTDLHDAVTSIDAGENLKGKIAEEMEKGYYLNDKVIRHAKVIVGS